MGVVHGYVSSGPCTPLGQIQTREKKQNITEAQGQSNYPCKLLCHQGPFPSSLQPNSFLKNNN